MSLDFLFKVKTIRSAKSGHFLALKYCLVFVDPKESRKIQFTHNAALLGVLRLKDCSRI